MRWWGASYRTLAKQPPPSLAYLGSESCFVEQDMFARSVHYPREWTVPKLPEHPRTMTVSPGRQNDAPAWVTEELIEETLRVWQPRYKHTLTREDAVGIILSVSRLFGALARG